MVRLVLRETIVERQKDRTLTVGRRAGSWTVLRIVAAIVVVEVVCLVIVVDRLIMNDV